MSFEPEPTIRVAVEKNDVWRLRAIILDRVIMRDFLTEDIRALVDWVVGHEKHTNAILNDRKDNSFPHTKNKSEWTYDYFQDQIADANDDFAFDRLQHILEVRQYLRDTGHEKLAPRPSRPGASPDEKGQREERFPSGKDIAIGAGTGIAAIVAFAKSNLVVGIGCLVIGGAYLFFSIKKNQQR